MNELKIRVKLDEGAICPTKSHEYDAGFDIYAREDAYIPQCSSKVFDTGVHIEIPKGYTGFLKSRSGLNVKKGITSEGVIDTGFTGSIKVKLYNHSGFGCGIYKGDRISQIVILPIPNVTLEVTDEDLTAYDRGDNGYGSSGR